MMTPNKIRLRALVACGWDIEVAKKHIRRHKRPTEGIEIMALAWWKLSKLWGGR